MGGFVVENGQRKRTTTQICLQTEKVHQPAVLKQDF